MIGKTSNLTTDALSLSLILEQLGWQNKKEIFEKLRNDANILLDKIGLDDVKIPDNQNDFNDRKIEIIEIIIKKLQKERSKILGDTIALPFFHLGTASYRLCILAPFGKNVDNKRELIENCLEDLGLKKELINNLDEELGWIMIKENEFDEKYINKGEVIKAGFSFIQRIIENWDKLQQKIEDKDVLLKKLDDIHNDVTNFRIEFQEEASIIESLIKEGNKKILDILSELEIQLIKTGMSEKDAKEITKENPKELRSKLHRWISGAKWRDVTERVLWSALDYVPGGSGVKLGIKIAKEIRELTKKPSN